MLKVLVLYHVCTMFCHRMVYVNHDGGYSIIIIICSSTSTVYSIVCMYVVCVSSVTMESMCSCLSFFVPSKIWFSGGEYI
jgi:hypothetical protein